MKIVAINGSSKGKASNTNVMVNALFTGARAGGAETVNIFLAEKNIHHCRGCHICWTKGPGQCVISDDMLEVLSHLSSANIIVFASPVYFENISGLLKAFMDRMTMIGSPHSQQDANKASEPIDASNTQIPRLMMVSSCGHPNSSEFDVTSLWINRVSQKMQMKLVGEIYAAQGKFLNEPPEELLPAVTNYLKQLEMVGREISTSMELSTATKKLLVPARAGFAKIPQ